MKPFLAAISAAGLLSGGLGIGAARALPRADVAATPEPVAQVRLVCNDRRCWHTGYRRQTWYRPYGYYRPYSGPPVRIGIGTFGVGIY